MVLQFGLVIISCFNLAYILNFFNQIAVDNGFGGVYGHQKADWMVDVVQQYFHDNGK